LPAKGKKVLSLLVPSPTGVKLRTGTSPEVGTRKGCPYNKRLFAGIPLAGMLATVLLTVLAAVPGPQAEGVLDRVAWSSNHD